MSNTTLSRCTEECFGIYLAIAPNAPCSERLSMNPGLIPSVANTDSHPDGWYTAMHNVVYHTHLQGAPVYEPRPEPLRR